MFLIAAEIVVVDGKERVVHPWSELDVLSVMAEQIRLIRNALVAKSTTAEFDGNQVHFPCPGNARNSF